MQGSYIPLPRTAADRKRASDPRPSIDERYRDKDQYVGLVTKAALALIDQGFLLAEDLPRRREERRPALGLHRVDAGVDGRRGEAMTLAGGSMIRLRYSGSRWRGRWLRAPCLTARTGRLRTRRLRILRRTIRISATRSRSAAAWRCTGSRCADCHGLDAQRLSRPGPDRASSPAARPTSGCSRRFAKACPAPKCRRQRADDPDDDLLMIIAYLRKLGTVAPPERPIGNVDERRAAVRGAVRELPSRRRPRRPARSGSDADRRRRDRAPRSSARSARRPNGCRRRSKRSRSSPRTASASAASKKNEDVFSIQIMDTRERIQGYLKSRPAGSDLREELADAGVSGRRG